jgi:dynein heavy chain, axonemal
MENRWEFDRKKLFDQTNYMAKICENLYQIAETLSQFNQFLGSDLKRVTKDTVGIGEVIQKVENLVAPLENLPFNIFDFRYNTSWEQVMKSFNEKVLEIENRTKNFITISFQKLRSAESAFQLLWNFNDINTREAFRNEMADKFKLVLSQYRSEVERVQVLFRTHRLVLSRRSLALLMSGLLAIRLLCRKIIRRLQVLYTGLWLCIWPASEPF